MSDTEDFFNSSNISSRRMERTTSLQSVEDTSDTMHNDSVSLLDAGGYQHEAPAAADSGVSVGVLRGLKRGVDTLVTEVKKLKEQNTTLDKKLTTVLKKNENLEKLMKEMSSKNNQSPDDLGELMTADGLKVFKMAYYRNLDHSANDKNEVEMVKKFMAKAKEDGWLVKNSGKAEKDILKHWRLKRNYLKAQIRARVFADMVNKTQEEAKDLITSEKFIKEHLGVPELNDDCLLILFNFAFTHLKYLNKKATLTTTNEKKVADIARKNVWKYVMEERVDSDREAGRDHTVIKERFAALLVTQDFQPID